MKIGQWEMLKHAVKHGSNMGDANNSLRRPPVALIADSPWIPGYCGMSHFEFFASPTKWLEANLKVVRDFPKVIFVPGFWVEYGMATEPSAFGCKVSWWENSPPSVHPVLQSIEDVRNLKVPIPTQDGLMSFVLHIYKRMLPEIRKNGYEIKIVAARGPLALASHLRGTTEFLLDLKLDPEKVHTLLDVTTETVMKWLSAQIKVLHEVEGILVLDDVVGMISPADYREFAHERLCQIFDEFKGYTKLYHNDANILSFASELVTTGLDGINFSHNYSIADMRQKMGPEICLMGNVPPLEILTLGKPDNVKDSVGRLRDEWYNLFGAQGKFLLSAGGGLSPGTPAENIHALVDGSESF